MIDLPAIPQEKVSFGHPDWISAQRIIESRFEKRLTDWTNAA